MTACVGAAGAVALMLAAFCATLHLARCKQAQTRASQAMGLAAASTATRALKSRGWWTCDTLSHLKRSHGGRQDAGTHSHDATVGQQSGKEKAHVRCDGGLNGRLRCLLLAQSVVRRRPGQDHGVMNFEKCCRLVDKVCGLAPFGLVAPNIASDVLHGRLRAAAARAVECAQRQAAHSNKVGGTGQRHGSISSSAHAPRQPYVPGGQGRACRRHR